jgi:hypothetical protein
MALAAKEAGTLLQLEWDSTVARAATAKAKVGATLVKHPEPRTFQFRSSPPKRGPRRRMIEWIPAYTGMSG